MKAPNRYNHPAHHTKYGIQSWLYNNGFHKKGHWIDPVEYNDLIERYALSRDVHTKNVLKLEALITSDFNRFTKFVKQGL